MNRTEAKQDATDSHIKSLEAELEHDRMPIVERVNGILKTEWLNVKTTATLTETTEFVGKIIGLYNHQRPHQSIGYMVPAQVHQTGIKTDKKWRNYF